MKTIPNINLKSLAPLIMNQVSNGGEAIICRGFKPNTLFKVYVQQSNSNQCNYFNRQINFRITTMSDNKLEKIKMIHSLQLEHSVLPLSTLTYNGRLIGYEMTYDNSDITFSKASMPLEERIQILKKSKNILEYFATHDIIYGDVNSKNILFSLKTGKVKFCDIDNIQIGPYPIDRRCKNSMIYELLGGKETFLDAYMHNIMTLLEFSKDEMEFMFSPVSELVKKDYLKYLTSSSKDVLQSMETPQTFNGEYVVKYIKK